MDEACDDVLAYTIYSEEHWPQIASSNPLERLNREIKRRTDVVGIFPNDRAVVRLAGAPMLDQNDKWAVGRHYVSLESRRESPSMSPSRSKPRHVGLSFRCPPSRSKGRL